MDDKFARTLLVIFIIGMALGVSVWLPSVVVLPRVEGVYSGEGFPIAYRGIQSSGLMLPGSEPTAFINPLFLFANIVVNTTVLFSLAAVAKKIHGHRKVKDESENN